eukprot:7206796-Pyramimonas_sp.AAC.1
MGIPDIRQDVLDTPPRPTGASSSTPSCRPVRSDPSGRRCRSPPPPPPARPRTCLLYTSDAADDTPC